MAVSSCTLIDDGCDLDSEGNFTHWAQYRVICDSRQDTGLEVLLGAALSSPDPIPSFKTSFSLNGSSDPNAFAQSFKAKRENVKDAAARWIVDVSWSPSNGDPDDDWTTSEDPLSRPPRINIDAEEVQVIVEEGWNEEALTGGSGGGRAADTFGPICNAAYQEPGTPLVQPRRIPVLVFRFNVADLSDVVTLINTYEDRLNSDTFYGAPEGTCLVRSIVGSDDMFAGETHYREVEIRIAIFDQGWSYAMVNRGYEYLLDSGDSWSLVMARKADEEGVLQLVTEPVNLELDGTRTPDGEIGTIIHWRTRPKVAFSGMGIGGGP